MSDEDSGPRTHQDEGNRAFKLGEWDKAVEAYSKAIALEPDNHVLYSNRSAAYVKLLQFEKAIADADTCIRLKYDYHKGHGRKGTALLAMQNYEDAVQAYEDGLKVAPDEEYLRMGLNAALFAKRENSSVQKAVRRTKAARQSSVSTQQKAKNATTASKFAMETRKQLKLEMAALQAQLDLLNEMERMSDESKLEMLFALIDENHYSTVGAAELANALRKGNKSLSLADSIERAIRTVAAFDLNGDTKLDFEEFKNCIEATRQELDMTLGEFAEFMTLQLTFSDGSGTVLPAEVAVDPPSIDTQVREQEEYIQILKDPRMQQLFHLFDKEDNMELSFKQVAAGLYRLSHSMAESTRTTMGLLFMLDKEDKRTLGYEQFGRLVMAVVAASNSSFDQVVDDLVFALTSDEPIPESELQALYIADSMYEGVIDMQRKQQEVSTMMDPVVYGRIQKLFDLWDTKNDGTISKDELVVGLQHFHEASRESGDPVEEAVSLLKFDHDGDHELDRLDFARALGVFAQAINKSLHEMIDFMVVTTAMGEKQTNSYKRAFRHSVSLDAAAMSLKEIKNVEVDD